MTINHADYEDAYEAVASEVVLEAFAQLDQWGEQNHDPQYGTGARREFARAAEKWRAIADARSELGRQAWDAILLEEVFEALAEEDPVRIREELVQAGAVILSFIASLDRVDTTGLTDEEISEDDTDGDKADDE